MEETIGFVLGIDVSDWHISESRQGIEDEVKVIHYTFEFCGNPGQCPDCGMPRTVHDYVGKTWRNENLGDSVCYIHARVPRFQCHHCGKTSMAQIPWADPKVSYTRRFMESAIEHMAQMSILAVARMMNTTWSVLDGIVGRVVDRYLNEMDLSKVKSIRIDETSAKKRHRYITVITDTETDDIIFISKGKDSKLLREFREWLLNHNGDPEKIELASMDFGDAFAKGVRENFPNAKMVRDPFHLIQIAERALDRDRSSSQVNGERKKSIRFALLKGGEKLTPEEKDIVMDFTKDHETVGLSYRMKESLRDAISYSPEESQLAFFHLRSLASWFKKSGSKGFKALGNTIENNIEAIVLAIESGVNNGFQEGLNGRIQLTKRLARGYHRETRLARMVFFRDANRSL